MTGHHSSIPNPQFLIAVGGLPGSGKSVAARMIAERVQARLLRSDVIRKALFPAPQYTPEEGRTVYGEMLRRAEEALEAGESVVLDATFYSQASRDAAAAIAQRCGAQWAFVLVTTPERLIRERIVQRKRDASDADFAVYRILKKQFEPVAGSHILLDNRGDLTTLARQIDAQLGGWLALADDC